jgi:hypothetical protein
MLYNGKEQAANLNTNVTNITNETTGVTIRSPEDLLRTFDTLRALKDDGVSLRIWIDLITRPERKNLAMAIGKRFMDSVNDLKTEQ